VTKAMVYVWYTSNMANPPAPALAPATQLLRPKIHALTSVRFFAALYVVLFHTRWGVTPGSLTDRFLSLGDSSVAFFFLLSGYILAFVYLRDGKPVHVRNFYVARFARIYPLYLVTLLADFPFAVSYRTAQYGLLHAIERVSVLFAASLFMMQMWIQASAGINGAAWTLGVEFVFYLSFPFLGVWLWTLNKREIAFAAPALCVCSFVMSWIVPKNRSYGAPGLDLISYIALFALGVLVARWQSRSARDGSDSKLNQKAWWALVIAWLGFAVVVATTPWLAGLNIRPEFLLALVFAAWIWALSAAQILPARLLSAPWIVILGEASFGLYLVHVPVLHLFKALHLAGSVWNYPLYLGTCIGLSVLSFYYLEAPARSFILKRLHTRTKETLDASSAAQ